MKKKRVFNSNTSCPSCDSPRATPESKYCDKCGYLIEAGAAVSKISNNEPSSLSPLDVAELSRTTSERFREVLTRDLAEQIDPQTAIGAGYAELVVRGLAAANHGGVEKISAANNRLADILRSVS